MNDILSCLKWYADTLCEYGTSNSGCGKYGPDVCAGCQARGIVDTFKVEPGQAVGALASLIVEIAPAAGLDVGITIGPAKGENQ